MAKIGISLAFTAVLVTAVTVLVVLASDGSPRVLTLPRALRPRTLLVLAARPDALSTIGNRMAWSAKCKSCPGGSDGVFSSGLRRFKPTLIWSARPRFGIPGRILDIQVSARWVAWVVAWPPAPGWKAWAMNLRTRRKVFIASDAWTGGPQGSYPSLILRGDMVIWSRPIRDTSAGQTSVDDVTQMAYLRWRVKHSLTLSTGCIAMSPIAVSSMEAVWASADSCDTNLVVIVTQQVRLHFSPHRRPVALSSASGRSISYVKVTAPGVAASAGSPAPGPFSGSEQQIGWVVGQAACGCGRIELYKPTSSSMQVVLTSAVTLQLDSQDLLWQSPNGSLTARDLRTGKDTMLAGPSPPGVPLVSYALWRRTAVWVAPLKRRGSISFALEDAAL